MILPRLVDKPLILYGYGKLGHLAEEIFKELHIPIAAIIEKDTIKMLRDYSKFLVAVCIASEPYEGIKRYLEGIGFTDIVPVWDIVEAYPAVGIHNGWFVGPQTDKEKHVVLDMRYRWGDYKSATQYLDFVLWHQQRTEWSSSFKIESAPSLPSTLVDIRRRQVVDMFADAPMKNISIHNEGCELKTLEENMHLFQKYRPSMEVAVYHSRDGLWAIEKYLMDSLPDYTWTFRLRAFMGQAAYIMGQPCEKVLDR